MITDKQKILNLLQFQKNKEYKINQEIAASNARLDEVRNIRYELEDVVSQFEEEEV